MRPTVLMFNLAPQKASALKLIGVQLGLRMLTVPKERFGEKLRALTEPAGEAAPAAEIPEELLVLCELPDGVFNLFLSELRRKKAGVALKAVLTETNSEWTAAELYTELCRERAAFEEGKTVHEQSR